MALSATEQRLRTVAIQRNIWNSNPASHEAGMRDAQSFLSEFPNSPYAQQVKASYDYAVQRYGKTGGIHNTTNEYQVLLDKYTISEGSVEKATEKLKQEGWTVSTSITAAETESTTAKAAYDWYVKEAKYGKADVYFPATAEGYNEAEKFRKQLIGAEAQSTAQGIRITVPEQMSRLPQQPQTPQEKYFGKVSGGTTTRTSDFAGTTITQTTEIPKPKEDALGNMIKASPVLSAVAKTAGDIYGFGYKNIFSPVVGAVPSQIKEPVKYVSKQAIDFIGYAGSKAGGVVAVSRQFKAGQERTYAEGFTGIAKKPPIYYTLKPLTEEQKIVQQHKFEEYGALTAQIVPYFTPVALPYAAVAVAGSSTREEAYGNIVGGAVLVGGLKGLGFVGGELAGVVGKVAPKVELGYGKVSSVVSKYALPVTFGGIAVASTVPIAASIEAGDFATAKELRRQMVSGFGGYTLGGAAVGYVVNPYVSYLKVPAEQRAEYVDLLKLKGEIGGQATLRKPLELEDIYNITPKEVSEIKSLIVTEKANITLGGSTQLLRAMVGKIVRMPRDLEIYANKHIDLSGLSKSTIKNVLGVKDPIHELNLVTSTQRTTLRIFEPTSAAFEKIEIKGTGKPSIPSGELSTPIKTKILNALDVTLKGVTGGTSAIKIQLGKGEFRAEGDIDYYVKSLSTAQKLKVISDVKLISGEKVTILESAKQLKIRGEAGKDIVNINVGELPKSIIVAGKRVRPLNELLSDKRAIAKFSPKAEKAAKAKADIIQIQAAGTKTTITGVKAVKPYNIFARKVMGGFEDKLYRYSKDIPAAVQFAKDVVLQRQATAATNVPVLKQYYQWKTGRASERLKAYEDLLTVEKLEPMKNRPLAKVSLFKGEWFKETKPQEFLGTKGTIGSSGKGKIVLPEYNISLPKGERFAYLPVKAKGNYPAKIDKNYSSLPVKDYGKKDYSTYKPSTYKAPSTSQYKAPYEKPSYLSYPAKKPSTYEPYSEYKPTAPYPSGYPTPTKPYSTYRTETPPPYPTYKAEPRPYPTYYSKTPPPYPTYYHREPPPPITKMIITGGEQPRPKPMQEDNQAYNALVYSRQKWKKVNREPLNKIAAHNEGAYYTDNSTAARYKTVKVAGTPKRVDLDLTASAANKFRGNKAGNFIERNTYRIDTPNEVRGIPLEGLLAQQRIRNGRLAF